MCWLIRKIFKFEDIRIEILEVLESYGNEGAYGFLISKRIEAKRELRDVISLDKYDQRMEKSSRVKKVYLTTFYDNLYKLRETEYVEKARIERLENPERERTYWKITPKGQGWLKSQRLLNDSLRR